MNGAQIEAGEIVARAPGHGQERVVAGGHAQVGVEQKDAYRRALEQRPVEAFRAGEVVLCPALLRHVAHDHDRATVGQRHVPALEPGAPRGGRLESDLDRLRLARQPRGGDALARGGGDLGGHELLEPAAEKVVGGDAGVEARADVEVDHRSPGVEPEVEVGQRMQHAVELIDDGRVERLGAFEGGDVGDRDDGAADQTLLVGRRWMRADESPRRFALVVDSRPDDHRRDAATGAQLGQRARTELAERSTVLEERGDGQPGEVGDGPAHDLVACRGPGSR